MVFSLGTRRFGLITKPFDLADLAAKAGPLLAPWPDDPPSSDPELSPALVGRKQEPRREQAAPGRPGVVMGPRSQMAAAIVAKRS
jgi:hypothetical protein